MTITDLQPIPLPDSLCIGRSVISLLGTYDEQGRLVGPGAASCLAIGVMVIDNIDTRFEGKGPKILFTSPANIQL